MDATLQHVVEHSQSTASAPAFADIYRRVAARLEAVDFSGADPCDGLNSGLFEKLPLSSTRLVRLAWLTLFKTSPLDLRALARVVPSTNAVTLALAARTYALSGEYEKMGRAVDQLVSLRSNPDRWGCGAWGYPFPWQSRTFYVPRNVPNVVATAYAIRTVAECCPCSDESDRIIADAAAFVEAELICRNADGTAYIGYAPQARTIVHHANLCGAYVLALAADRDDHTWRSSADAAIDYTVRAQNADGSWPYAESSHHRPADGFHTGCVLEALQNCRRLLQRDDLAEPIARGTQHYLKTFMRDDGVVPYYANGRGALDVNNFAQMVITLACVQPTSDWIALADRTLSAAIRELWCPEMDAFAYQRRGWHINRIFYPRWTQIWMMYALGLRLAHKGASEPGLLHAHSQP
jgi:hypothetical protein